jgi:hypothetical protein
MLQLLVKNRQYIPHLPTPKQAAFAALDIEEAMFGGAASGGKSDALLMAALQFVHVPGYNALILRKTYGDLNQPNAIMARALSWLRGTDARWNSTAHRWYFPSGATLTFGHLSNANAHLQYQGAELQFVAFDELTQFASFQYRYLFSRLRKLTNVDIPLRMRSASNPGGPGHDWVKRRFIDRKKPGRTFIPALLGDNPHVDQAAYRRMLAKLDPVTRKRLEEGDWHATAAGLVYPDFPDTKVTTHQIPWEKLTKSEAYGGIDWGWNNPFAAIHGVLDDDDVLWWVWCRYKRFQTVAQHARKLPRDNEMQQTMWFADPSRPENIADLLQADFVCRKAPNDIESGKDLVKERIRTGRLKVLDTLVPIFTEAGQYVDANDQTEDDDDDDDDHVIEANSLVTDADADSYDMVGDTVLEEAKPHADHLMDAGRYMVAGIAKIRGVTWADDLATLDAHDDDRKTPEEGSYGQKGWAGDEEEDYTKPPKKRTNTPEPTKSKNEPPTKPSIFDGRWWSSGY